MMAHPFVFPWYGSPADKAEQPDERPPETWLERWLAHG
jgi:hypothetical protein